MKQVINEQHTADANGNPTGGTTTGRGIDIRWQNGQLGRGADRVEPNGAFVEGVIQAAIGRLEFFQKANGGKFWCIENQAALVNLQLALTHLEARTKAREERAVDGTHTP